MDRLMSEGEDNGIVAVRCSTRLAKKPRRDSCTEEKKPPVEEKKEESKPLSPEAPEKQKKNREYWTSKDKDIFFEALCEHGKDFDALQAVLESKNRRKFPNSLYKTKNQIRHFYYRTCSKLSKFIEETEKDSRQSVELAAVINFGEMRRKIGEGSDILEKQAAKFNELMQKGTTVIKFKNKNQRIKTPVCPALQKAVMVKIPSVLTLTLMPRTNGTWQRVQDLSLNPRTCLKVNSMDSLSYVVSFLEQRLDGLFKEALEEDPVQLRVYLLDKLQSHAENRPPSAALNLAGTEHPSSLMAAGPPSGDQVLATSQGAVAERPASPKFGSVPAHASDDETPNPTVSCFARSCDWPESLLHRLSDGVTSAECTNLPLKEIYLATGGLDSLSFEYDWGAALNEPCRRLQQLSDLWNLCTTEDDSLLLRARSPPLRGQRSQRPSMLPKTHGYADSIASRVSFQAGPDSKDDLAQQMASQPSHSVSSAFADQGGPVFRVPTGGAPVRASKISDQMSPATLLQRIAPRTLFGMPPRRSIRRKPVCVQRALMPKSQAPEQKIFYLIPNVAAAASSSNSSSTCTFRPPAVSMAQQSDQPPPPTIESSDILRRAATSARLEEADSVDGVPEEGLQLLTSTPRRSTGPPTLSLLDLSMPAIDGKGDSLNDISPTLTSQQNFSGLFPESRNELAQPVPSASILSPSKLVRGSSNSCDVSQWLHGDDISLSQFLSDSPSKSAAPGVAGPVLSVPSSLLCESSRDSLGIDSTLQCLLNENSMEFGSKFADLAEQVS